MTTGRLAAILAADVVGFSSMMEKDEEGTLKAPASPIGSRQRA
jgi:class 3 adenylate cyclase